MSLDQLGRGAALDLLEHTRPDPVAGLGDLRRLHARRNVERVVAAALVLLVAIGIGWTSSRGDTDSTQPIDRHRGVRNGVLVTSVGGEVVELGTSRRVLTATPQDLAQYSSLQFTADGSQIVYENRRGQVAAIDVTTGSTRVLSSCPADGYCDFGVSPDGETVGFHGPQGLELHHVTDGSVNHLAAPVGAGSPRWSPDGRFIAFSSQRGIHVIRADGTGLRLVVPLSAHRHVVAGVSWSPDARSIAFARMDDVLDRRDRIAEFAFTLVTANVDGSGAREVRPLGRCVCTSTAPPTVAWSPDGTLLAFSHVGSGRQDSPGDDQSDLTYVVHPDGTGLRRVGAPGRSLTWQPVRRR